jgi:hypothetical protein
MLTHNEAVRDACHRLCGGEYDRDRVALPGLYTVAWLNYYLRGEPDHFSQIYGDLAADDVDAGRVALDAQTAPIGVSVSGGSGEVVVEWRAFDSRAVAGYNIYRRSDGDAYPPTPHARVAAVAAFVDTDVVPGERYYYTVRSRDAGGNEHLPSREVSVVAVE